MKGLSITAIGKREFTDCLSIFNTLKQPLQLDYLELAVGSRCDLSLVPDDLPIVLHHQCLHHNKLRLPFSLIDKSTWKRYREAIVGKNVLMWSIHAPLIKEVNRLDFQNLVWELTEYMNIPICVEVMPFPEFYLSTFTSTFTTNIPLLLDVSHVNIWYKNSRGQVEHTIRELLEYKDVRGIHLSENTGRLDSHDMFDKSSWFYKYIDEWALDYLVTYESLPREYKEFERLDKNKKK